MADEQWAGMVWSRRRELLGTLGRSDEEIQAAAQSRYPLFFCKTQTPKDEGIPLLIEVARTSRNPEVRRKAVFWLGQSRDPRALAFIEDVLK